MKSDKFVGEDGLVGKTIAKVGSPSDGNKTSWLIAFADGSFTKISYNSGYYDYDPEIEFDDDIEEWDTKWLVANGVTP